jgi:DtxR family Mn-dependent transcriptional regulator
MTSKSEYLLALYIEESRTDPPISFETIAETLERSPATVTEMCQRLDEDNFVTHKRYKGVTLTEEGRATAEACHQRYVILSWFFKSVLDLDDYEREAMKMAGEVSPDIARRLAETLPHVETPQSPVHSANVDRAEGDTE